ncbi:MAG: tetratricopeptide repeat protein [Prevotella sp.]|jgi:tetratricopeptide (TPR) repeat protein
MKTYKYLLMGALLLGSASASFAQEDNKAIIERATAIIKSKSPDAADQIKEIAKDNKKNPEVLTGIGRAYLEQVKDTAQANIFADKALARNSKYAKAWILKGDIEIVKDNAGEAAAAFQNAIYFDPKDPQGYYKYAMVQRGVNPEVAASTLENLRKQRPDYPVDQLIGHIYYNAQDFEKAVNAYSKVSNINSMDDENITEYAMSSWLLGQREKSIEVCKTALTKNPRKAAWNRLAFYNYTDLKDGANALTYADKLFNASDSAHFIAEDYVYYGTALKLEKRFDEALQQFSKAADMNKDNQKQLAVIYKNMSDLYLEKGDYDNAVAYFEKSIAGVDKPSMDNLDNLGTLWADIASKKLKAGDKTGADAAFKSADQAYAKMSELYPNYKNYCCYMRGQVNANLDPDSKQGLAKPYYEELANNLAAKSELGDSEKAMIKQAYTYLIVYNFNVLKDKDTAVSYAEKLLQVDPENEIAKQVAAMK